MSHQSHHIEASCSNVDTALTILTDEPSPAPLPVRQSSRKAKWAQLLAPWHMEATQHGLHPTTNAVGDRVGETSDQAQKKSCHSCARPHCEVLDALSFSCLL